MKAILVSALVLILSSIAAAKDEIQIGDLVKQHVSSIGSEQARAAIKTRVVQGNVKFRVLNVTSGNQDGKAVLVSEEDKLVSLLKLPNPTYHGERFVSDGSKTLIAEVRPGDYSEFGSFVRVHNEILTEGLWGGSLSTGWALAHLEERHAKLQFRGLKKTGSEELYEVRYIPGKKSDLDILLYFDPATFRHVKTVYSLTIAPPMGRTERESASVQESHYRLEERFSDFKNSDNLMLPTHWVIQFTPDVPEENVGRGGRGGAAPLGAGPSGGQGGHFMLGAAHNAISEFEVNDASISHNVSLDPKNFEVK